MAWLCKTTGHEDFLDFINSPFSISSKSVISGACRGPAENPAVSPLGTSHRDQPKICENLPAKGNEGNWGQTPEQISLILEKTREVLVTQFGYKAEDAIAAIGMTLDIGHALAENKLEAESVLSKWLKELGQDIKCFHVGADSNLPMMEVKLRLLRELCEKYQIEVPIFLESKVDLATTEDIYDVTKIGLRS